MAEIRIPSSTAKVKDVEELKALIAKVKEAQLAFAQLDQAAVDTIFKAAALSADQAAETLAKEAVSETGMGNLEDKITKNRYAAEFIYSRYRETPTAGIIERGEGYMKVAEPLGVLAAVVPCTNPTATAIFKSLLALKTRNGLVFSPHPRAKKCTAHAVDIVYRAAVKAGAPKGILACLEEPSVETSSALMKLCDCTLATGGPGMVQSAYSSGKPALGVGPGNVAVVVDASADLNLAASCITHSKTFDNGVICASEQNCVFVGNDADYARFVESLTRFGAYFVKAEEMDKFRAVLMRRSPKDPSIMSANPAIVGKSAVEIGKLAGVEVPAGTRILVGELASYDPNEPWAHEKLSPTLSLIKVSNFDEGLKVAEEIIAHGGYGHTAALHINPLRTKQIERFALTLETCRILINTPTSQGAIGGIYNDPDVLRPSLTLGCGSWGGNSTWENIGVDNLLNIKTVTIADEKLSDECLLGPKILRTGKGIFKTSLDWLLPAGAAHHVGLIASRESEKAVEKVISRLPKKLRKSVVQATVEAVDRAHAATTARLFKRSRVDLIIAVGGDDAFSQAKAVRLLMNNPSLDFTAHASVFLAQQNRIARFADEVNVERLPALVTVATTAWARLGVSQTMYLDEKEGRLTIWDELLLPEAALIDIDLLNDSKITRYTSAYAAVSRLISAACSTACTEQVMEQALKGIKAAEKIFAKKSTREREMVLGLTSALAISNAYGGIVDALAEGLHHAFQAPVDLAACALLPACLAQALNPAPSRMGIAAGYLQPQGQARIRQLAGRIGFKGPDSVIQFVDHIASVRVDRHLPTQMADLGIDPTNFKRGVDKAVAFAFKQQSMVSAPVAARPERVKELLTSLM